MSRLSSMALSAVLIVLGALSAFVAINVAFGGILTLGWQGSTDFVTITDQGVFDVRDSHTRFYGGVYLGIGLFFILAATNIRRYQSALFVVLALVFMGGLARLTQLQPEVTFGPAIITSMLIEIVLMPALFLWVRAETRQPAVAPRPGASSMTD